MNRKHKDRSVSIGAFTFTLALLLIWVSALTALPARAQQASTSSQQLPESPTPQNNAPQNLPEAPSATAPPAPAPSAPLPKSGVASPADLMPNEANQNTTEPPLEPAPKPTIKTMPRGSAPGPDPGSREQLWVMQRQVNFVTVPVSVKDRDGHLVEGLLANNFSVYEDGVKQNLKFFTSDPFPLSAAVVIDLGMSDQAASKVRESLPALIGAFGQFDEVSIFTYGNTVKKWQDITPADKIPSSMLRQLKAQKGGPSGAPVVGGPLGQPGPVINGRNMDNTPNIPSMPNGQVQQSQVLNDAILAAAQNLARRDRMRRAQPEQGADYRKILFVISDGRELGSIASYADVMQVLLSNNITVYAIGVGGAAMPIYGKLSTLNLPKTGVGNILPKYASATGGQVYTEFGRAAIESAYSRVTSEARNQYTLGYTTRATPSSNYRTIEVRVSRPGLRVYARDGYYPLPPPRPVSVSEP
jgi:VWFA-related protein